MKTFYTIFFILVFLPVVTYAQQRYSHIKRVKTEKIEKEVEDKSDLIKMSPVHSPIINNQWVMPTSIHEKLHVNEDIPETSFVNTNIQTHQRKNIYQAPAPIKKMPGKKHIFKINKTNKVYTAKPAMETDLLIFIIILVVGVILFTIGLIMQLVWMIPIWGIVVTIVGASLMSVGAFGLIFFR